MSGTVEAPTPARMLDLLSGFIHELRAAGLPVSMTENLDAMRALAHVPLEERLTREELEWRVQRFREEVEAEIRRRLVLDRGPQALARSLRAKLPEDVDFMHASREEMAALQRAIGPLARALAARLAMRR